MLEAHTAALAARTADAEAIQRLRERWEAQCDATGLEPLERTLRARDFHAEISRIAHSGRLSAVLDGLHREMVRAHHVLPELRWHLAEDIELREHREILEAIAAGEAEPNAQAMRTHLESILGHLGIAASEVDRS
ncbi:FCD domain-containing protein [Kocuria sp. p3-SID1433]|nr:FCD domain-containing protein [Kocuria sp. p3-SID1428]MCT2179427.1 FCD domain-containing protein [Kocuria sp. p3-SID1433]